MRISCILALFKTYYINIIYFSPFSTHKPNLINIISLIFCAQLSTLHCKWLRLKTDLLSFIKEGTTKLTVKIVPAEDVYTVSFYNGANELIDRQMVQEGDDAEVPNPLHVEM